MSEDVPVLVEHLFRRAAGRLVASLVRRFGPSSLDLAEDVVQEAMLRALQTWPWRGIPRDPEAWLLRVARNRAFDRVRRSARWEGERCPDTRELLPGEARATPAPPPLDPAAASWGPASVPGDDELALLFLCCHPALPPDAAVALTLKVAGGLSVEEIAAAFLATPATVAQRIVRATRALRQRGMRFEVPDAAALEPRLGAVLRVLYLMFNEGYAASGGDALVRAELCGEAVRLGRLLAAAPATALPPTHALLALMLLQASRLPGRTDADGEILLLAEQDRRRWDRPLVHEAMVHLDRSARGPRLTSYHLEAGVAACHAVAPSWEATDWPRILACYDGLREVAPSPVVTLNRAVAVAMVEGPERGLDALEALDASGKLARYHLLPAVRGDLLERAGRPGEAAVQYRRALMLARSAPVRRLLEGRLERLDGRCHPTSGTHAFP